MSPPPTCVLLFITGAFRCLLVCLSVSSQGFTVLAPVGWELNMQTMNTEICPLHAGLKAQPAPIFPKWPIESLVTGAWNTTISWHRGSSRH